VDFFAVVPRQNRIKQARVHPPCSKLRIVKHAPVQLHIRFNSTDYTLIKRNQKLPDSFLPRATVGNHFGHK
jgi:hypothetical protein